MWGRLSEVQVEHKEKFQEIFSQTIKEGSE